MLFEPRAIVFNFGMMAVVGGKPLMFETASPELEGSFRSEDGWHGTVSVPLLPSERDALRSIVEAATERAIARTAGAAGVR